MKKLALLAAVLLGTAAASQAGIDVRIGIPFPPLPRVIFGDPAPRHHHHHHPRVIVAPRCGPAYGCGYDHHGHGYGHYRHGSRCETRHVTRSHHHGHSRHWDSHHGTRGHHGRR